MRLSGCQTSALRTLDTSHQTATPTMYRFLPAGRNCDTAQKAVWRLLCHDQRKLLLWRQAGAAEDAAAGADPNNAIIAQNQGVDAAWRWAAQALPGG